MDNHWKKEMRLFNKQDRTLAREKIVPSLEQSSATEASSAPRNDWQE